MDKIIKLEFTLQELQTILNGLQELTYKVSAQVINKIMTEAEKQTKAE